MPDPFRPLTALGQPDAQTLTIGPVTITERFDVALASVALRRDRDKDLAKLAKAVGLPLPDAANHAAGTPYSAFWMTPDMWMAEAPLASHDDIAATLKLALGDAASITEQSDAWVRFDLTAPDLTPLLERLTNLDLPTKSDGFAARTVIDHLGTYLIKHTPTEVTLYAPRASAQSLLHALQITAQSLI